jgi:hypothetical protein
VLLDQAVKLDERAEQLRQGPAISPGGGGAAGAGRVAEREPLRVLPGHHHVSRDDRLQARILRLLDQMGPLTSSQLAEHIGITQQRARRGLQLLEEDEKVRARRGRGRHDLGARLR